MAVIAVVGAGVMGADVALTCAAFGHRVILRDIDATVLERVRRELPQKLRGYRMMGLALPAADEVLERIRPTLDLEELAAADWVVENIPEDERLKRELYGELGRYCGPQTRVAVNTSCLSVTRLAALLPQPERVVGAHFMNPVPLKHTVEVIEGYHTDRDTLQAIQDLLHSLGKKAVVVKDFPGFVSNRLSHLFMNEAAFLVQDGVAAPAAVDAIFRDGYGHKMGPLETADLIGLDTVVRSLEVLYQAYQDSKFRCCPLLRQLVDAGQLGRKSGRGFYDYGA